MSIATRIESIEGHISDAYQGLQGLGADLTNVNKNIENISMVLDDIYDSMPQVSGEGTSLTLEDTRVGKIKSTLKGNTSQNGTPTPTSPIPINVVSGDNEINVVGKNLLDIEHSITLSSPGMVNVTKGNNYIVGSTSSDTWANLVLSFNLEVGTYYYKHFTNYSGTTNVQGLGTIRINKGSQSGQEIANQNTSLSIVNQINAISFTVAEAGTYVITYRFGNNVATARNITIQDIILSKTDTTYELYQGANYQVNLGSLELCKIGNYQDRIYKDNGKWYIEKNIGKIVLDGSESWSLRAFPDNSYLSVKTTLQIGANGGYCDKFISNNNYDLVEEHITLNSQWKECCFAILKSRISTPDVAGFKTWLGTNLPIVYYVLATPTNTEITYQPLIDQLNELEKAMSKDGQTNISQVNNDLPFIISASALKEWQESTSLNSTLSMVSPLSLGNTLNTQENDIQPIEVDNIEPLEEEENE